MPIRVAVAITPPATITQPTICGQLKLSIPVLRATMTTPAQRTAAVRRQKTGLSSSKTGEENGCCQTDVQQLDRKPLLRIQHSFHHLIPSAILTSTFMAICISDCAVLFQL
jgi:hypothetical protein